MRLVSWNIDGLDGELVEIRHTNLVPIISQFDVIFLQEVVGQSLDIIKSQMVDYHHFVGRSIDDYFVTISLHKDKFTHPSATYSPFEGSVMGE